MKIKAMPLKPIAICRTDTDDTEVPKNRRNMVTKLEILEPYSTGLLGIDAYSHLIIMFWMDRVIALPLVAHPRGDSAIDKAGAFATRGRNHPNPIGLAVTELLAVGESTITVKGLDAFDGTPVIDIKPYDHYDVVPNPKVPEWFKRKRRTPTIN